MKALWLLLLIPALALGQIGRSPFYTVYGATTATPPAAWDPGDTTNLWGWWKADGLSLSDGDSVGTWYDSSGNGRNMTLVAGAQKPIYKTNILNSLPVVRFTIAGQQALAAGGNSGGQGFYTTFIVAKSQSASTNSYAMAFGGPGLAIIHGFADNLWEYYQTPRTTLDSISTTAFKIIVDTMAAPGTTSFTEFGGNGAAEYWGGDVAEIIVFSYETDVNAGITRVKAYLNTKYGL
jgi:hypothetical protein